MIKRPQIGDIVYLKTGEDREAKMITAVLKRYKSVQYELTGGINSSWHYPIEFSEEKRKDKLPTIKGLR